LTIILSDGVKRFPFPIKYDLSALKSIDYNTGGSLVIETTGSSISGFESSGELEIAQNTVSDRTVNVQLFFNGAKYGEGVIDVSADYQKSLIEFDYELTGSLKNPRFDLIISAGLLGKSVSAEKMASAGTFKVEYSIVYGNGTLISSWVSAPYDFCAVLATCSDLSFVSKGAIDLFVDPVGGSIKTVFVRGPSGNTGAVAWNRGKDGNGSKISDPTLESSTAAGSGSSQDTFLRDVLLGVAGGVLVLSGMAAVVYVKRQKDKQKGKVSDQNPDGTRKFVGVESIKESNFEDELLNMYQHQGVVGGQGIRSNNDTGDEERLSPVPPAPVFAMYPNQISKQREVEKIGSAASIPYAGDFVVDMNDFDSGDKI
jgi:hypothetical protein